MSVRRDVPPHKHTSDEILGGINVRPNRPEYLGVHHTDMILDGVLADWLVDQHLFHDSFEEINTGVWQKTLSTACTIEADVESGLPVANFYVSAITDRAALLNTLNSYWGDCKWQLIGRLKFSTNTYIGCDFSAHYEQDVNNWYYIGFYYRELAGGSGTLKAKCRNGLAANTTEVIITSTPDMTSYHKFWIIRYSSSKVEFYVDDVLEATITSNVPSTNMEYRLYLSTYEDASKNMYVRSVAAQELAV